MAKKPEFKPQSLAQSFIPPDGLRGSFGWLCGYSADRAFMNDVAGRFTLANRGTRAQLGQLSLALITDPVTKQITLHDAPGVAHLPIRAKAKPFRLLHAKVALLLFKCQQGSGDWHLRLVVSTGNWTRQTVEDSLDMAWTVDVGRSDIIKPSPLVQQACADIKAAAGLFTLLRRHADTRLLDAVPSGRNSSASSGAIAQFEHHLKLVIKHAAGAQRFFDNREQSLLSQLAGLASATGKAAARNYIALGSGFFEGGSSPDTPPAQLSAIMDTLQQARLLTKSAECHVIVNPLACQAVATSFDAMLDKGWQVFGAAAPAYFRANSPRSLHAKFIFSAHRSSTDGKCASGWLYLGSGNLTGPGFGNKMHPASGNLEAGVVLASGLLQFKTTRPEELLSNLLPIGADGKLHRLKQAPAAGAPADERSVQFHAGPVACLLWRQVGANGCLSIPEVAGQPLQQRVDFTVLDEAGAPCEHNTDDVVIWPGPRPRQVRLRWGEQGTLTCIVPVLDERGQLAATDAPAIGLDEAWLQLQAFPMAPEDDDDDTGDGTTPKVKRPTAARGSKAGSYPVRQMMQLLENIAHKQNGVSQSDWSAWCWRLEQSLLQAAGSPIVGSFLELKLNPLHVLRVDAFVPDFCLIPGSGEMAAYEKTLQQVERAWKVHGLAKLGEFA